MSSDQSFGVVWSTKRHVKTSTISVSDIAAITSSTPPLEVVRLFCSLKRSMKGAGGEPLVLQFLDVSRAYPHVDVLRDDFYVETVPEMELPEDTSLFDARCTSSPIVSNSCFVHGSDYVGLGVRGDLKSCKAKLCERFIIKDRGILGTDGLHDQRILNRVITYHQAKPECPEMLTYERIRDTLICSWLQSD